MTSVLSIVSIESEIVFVKWYGSNFPDKFVASYDHIKAMVRKLFAPINS